MPAITPPSPALGSKMDSKALAVIATRSEVAAPAKPVIQLTAGDDHSAVYQAEEVLAQMGNFYLVGGEISRLATRNGSPICERINSETLYVLLSENIVWQYKTLKGDWEPCSPPHRIVTTLLRTQERKHLKTLNGIAPSTLLRTNYPQVGYDFRL